MALTNEEYQSQQEQIFNMANLLNMMPDLSAFIEMANHSENIGCFLDPTLWIKGVDKLGFIKTVASAIQEAKSKIEKAKEKMGHDKSGFIVNNPHAVPGLCER